MTALLQLNLLTNDPKRLRVLEAAAEMFLAYGFGRTTMDDIARAAEMSRPAVYQHFKNKTEIYRELAANYAARLTEESKLILAGDGPLKDRIASMFEAGLICMKEELEASPHGAEMLDMKDEISGELIENCRADIAGALAGAIDGEARRNGVDLAKRGLTADLLANIVLDGFDGAKERGVSAAALREVTQGLSRLVALAVGR